MSTSDRTNDDPVWNEACAFELNVMPEESKISTSLQHYQNSDPVAMPTMQRILACGVNHWHQCRDRYLLSFDFANENQGLIPVQKTLEDGKTVMGQYNGVTNEIVFDDVSQNILLKWSDERQTLASRDGSSWLHLDPIRTYYQSCPLKWVPKFQTDTKWLSFEFPKGKLGQVHTCRLYFSEEVIVTAQRVPIQGDGFDENGPYSVEGFVDLNYLNQVLTIQKTCTFSGKTANIKCKTLQRRFANEGFMGSVQPQNGKYIIRPIISYHQAGSGYTQAIENAFAMDKMLEEAKELDFTQPQNDFSAHFPFHNYNIWNMTTRNITHRFHLYFYGTIETNCIGVIGYEENLAEKLSIYGQIDLSTQKMILYWKQEQLEVTWIASEEKFQGYDTRGFKCVIEPVINKYESSTLYEILENPECQVSKPNMMILKAFFEGKIKGAKVYSVPNRKRGQSILKQEAHFQRYLGNRNDQVVKIHEAFSLQSPSGQQIVLIMDWYQNGSMSHQIKLRAHLKMKFTEAEILTILRRLLYILNNSKYGNIWHRDIKPDNILANDNGLPDIMDFGEAIRSEEGKGQPIKLAGTPKYMSYKLKTAFRQWRIKQSNTPLPLVEHDLEASDVMSLAQTVIAMCRLSENANLNDLETCDERQKIVWEDLGQHYSEGLVLLLQSMMRQDEKHRHSFSGATEQVENLLEKINLDRYKGLAQISIAHEVDQIPDQEDEDELSQTVSRNSFTHEGQGTCNTFADRNLVDQASLIESFKNCIVNGSMSQVEDSDTDEDPMEEEKLDY